MTDDDSVGLPADELTGEVGPPDVATMRSIRDVFLDAEPLVASAAFDTVLQPRELVVEFEDGIDTADQCRLDITWLRSGAYRFHYVDSDGVNWRFDRHPNPHSAEKHFHEPPDARSHDAVDSCIAVERPELVARAVSKLWRRAYDAGSFGDLNTATNPP